MFLVKMGVMLVSLPFSLLWQGYVLSTLYAWFVAFGELGSAKAAGLLLVVKMVKGVKMTKSEEVDVAWELYSAAILPLLVLGTGWCLKSFMDRGW